MKKLLVLVLLVLLFSACKQPRTPSNERAVETLINAELGGTVVLPNGATLSIPANALQSDTKISIELTNEEAVDKTKPIYDFGPDGLTFSKPVAFTFPVESKVEDRYMSIVYHQSDLNPTLDLGSEQTNWLPLTPTVITENSVTVEFQHFSALRVLNEVHEKAYLVFDLDEKYLSAGDILFTLTTYDPAVGGILQPDGANWRPGHIGIFAPIVNQDGQFDQPTRIIESSGSVNDINTLSGFKSGATASPHIYIDARRSKDSYSLDEQKVMLDWLEAQKGKAYSKVGNQIFADEYSCVSLADTMLSQIGDGMGLTIPTPIDLYEATKPIRSITANANRELRIPIYGVVVDPDSASMANPNLINGLSWYHSYYCKNCNNTIKASNLPAGARLEKQANGSYLLIWTPSNEDELKTFDIDFEMTATIKYDSLIKSDDSIIIKDSLSISVFPTFKVTAAVGKGEGLMVSSPEGINCGDGEDKCEAYFPVASTVIIEAGGASKEWWLENYEGDCAGFFSSCSLLMDADKSFVANFRTFDYLLTVDVESKRSSAVIMQPPNLTCVGLCDYGYQQDEVVLLSIRKDAAETFEGWGGACLGKQPTCSVTMDAAKTVNAYFQSGPLELSVTKAGKGEGSVTGSGITCPDTCSEKSTLPTVGQTITLTAAPAKDASFKGWSSTSNVCTGTNLICSFKMPSYNVEVIATFDGPPELLVKKKGEGEGEVIGSGIDCDKDCAEDDAIIAASKTVTLTANAEQGSTFVTWSNADNLCAGKNPTCSFTMPNKQTVVTAEFAVTHRVLTLNKEGVAKGSVAGSGINCDTACASDTADVTIGDTVTLTAEPDAKADFEVWTNTKNLCAGANPVCSFVMPDEDVVIEAGFKLKQHSLFVTKDANEGTVTGSGINCDAPCTSASTEVTVDAPITLTATPVTGYVFKNWSNTDNLCAGANPQCQFVMPNKQTVVIAVFEKQSSELSLSVIKDGNGRGAITGSGVNCVAGCSAANTLVAEGTTVSLTAAAEQDSAFKGWTSTNNVCTGTALVCSFSMPAVNTLVTAVFDKVSQTNLISSVSITDPAGHLPFTGNPVAVGQSISVTDTAVNTVRVTGSSSVFVTVTGESEGNTIIAEGVGTVANYPNIKVRLEMSFDELTGKWLGKYTMGVDGGLPGGQPIVFEFEAAPVP